MKKRNLLMMGTLSLSLLSCRPDLVPVPISNFSQSNKRLMQQIEHVKSQNPDLKKVYNIDLGQGEKRPGSFALSIHSSRAETFQTQGNVSGSLEKAKTDIQAFRIILINSATFPTPGPVAMAQGPFTVDASFSANNQTLVTFTNVPTGNYYACIAAFESNATFDLGTNITTDSSPHRYPEGTCFITNTGGDGGSPGRVTIDGAGNVVAAAPLGVNVQLTDPRGAKIQTDVTVVNGV